MSYEVSSIDSEDPLYDYNSGDELPADDIGDRSILTYDGCVIKSILSVGRGFNKPGLGDEIFVKWRCVDTVSSKISTEALEDCKVVSCFLGFNDFIPHGVELGIREMKVNEISLIECDESYERCLKNSALILKKESNYSEAHKKKRRAVKKFMKEEKLNSNNKETERMRQTSKFFLSNTNEPVNKKKRFLVSLEEFRCQHVLTEDRSVVKWIVMPGFSRSKPLLGDIVTYRLRLLPVSDEELSRKEVKGHGPCSCEVHSAPLMSNSSLIDMSKKIELITCENLPECLPYENLSTLFQSMKAGEISLVHCRHGNGDFLKVIVVLDSFKKKWTVRLTDSQKCSNNVIGFVNCTEIERCYEDNRIIEHGCRLILQLSFSLLGSESVEPLSADGVFARINNSNSKIDPNESARSIYVVYTVDNGSLPIFFDDVLKKMRLNDVLQLEIPLCVLPKITTVWTLKDVCISQLDFLNMNGPLKRFLAQIFQWEGLFLIDYDEEELTEEEAFEKSKVLLWQTDEKREKSNKEGEVSDIESSYGWCSFKTYGPKLGIHEFQHFIHNSEEQLNPFGNSFLYFKDFSLGCPASWYTDSTQYEYLGIRVKVINFLGRNPGSTFMNHSPILSAIINYGKGNVFFSNKLYQSAIDRYLMSFDNFRFTDEYRISLESNGLSNRKENHPLSEEHIDTEESPKRNSESCVAINHFLPQVELKTSNLLQVPYQERSLEKNEGFFTNDKKLTIFLSTVFYNLSTSFFLIDNFRDSLLYAEKALKISFETKTCLRVGLANMKLGFLKKARDNIIAARDLSPNDKNVEAAKIEFQDTIRRENESKKKMFSGIFK